MPDYAPNFTARYRFHYSSLGKRHAMTWRIPAGVLDPTILITKVGAFLANMAPLLFSDFTLLTAEFCHSDSDVFLPAPTPASPVGAVPTANGVVTDSAYSLSFHGRTALGGRARMFLYGTSVGGQVRLNQGFDMRLVASEEATVAAAVATLGSSTPSLVGNDDSVASWYPYADIKLNDRWLRKLRNG